VRFGLRELEGGRPLTIVSILAMPFVRIPRPEAGVTPNAVPSDAPALTTD
jgi:hypothetical protein